MRTCQRAIKLLTMDKISDAFTTGSQRRIHPVVYPRHKCQSAYTGPLCQFYVTFINVFRGGDALNRRETNMPVNAKYDDVTISDVRYTKAPLEEQLRLAVFTLVILTLQDSRRKRFCTRK